VNNKNNADTQPDSVETIRNRLSQIEEERQKLVADLEKLQRDYPSSISDISNINGFLDPLTTKNKLFFSQAERIKLFHSFFRGRDDVFARFWQSRKNPSKKGYSPVCKNEWVEGKCEKLEKKCSKCTYKEYVPLSTGILSEHLAGKQVIGIYPMLTDDSCHFLAVDFDGEGWKDNVFTFKETCGKYYVPVAIERSQSGNGAHAWIFFHDKVPAKTARQMGSFLITETMNSRYKMSMRSYDRLFPNQDNIPKEGLGNLIALPFQKHAAAKGNTLFIDENCRPYDDQWDYLSKVTRMPCNQVEELATEAVAMGRIIGVRAEFEKTTEEEPPWERLPSGKSKRPLIMDSLPSSIDIVSADRLYMETKNMPSPFLNQVKRLAAFQNPQFYKLQNLRKSTSLVPRVICCSEILDDYLTLPRGCLDELSSLCSQYGIKINIKDARITGSRVDFKFNGMLEKEQKDAAKIMLEHDIGILVAPPGSGKTVLAIHLIAERKTNTLVLVHRKPLQEQWQMQLSAFLHIDKKHIGQIGGGKEKDTGIIDVAMMQSLQKKGTVNDIIEKYGFIIVDECHRIPAASFERVLLRSKAKYVLGLTATPYHYTGHQPIINMQCGPIRCRIKDSEDAALNCAVIVRKTGFACKWDENSRIQDIWPLLVNDKKRNRMIVDDIIDAIKQERFPLILTERREHLQLLSDMLKDNVKHLAVLHGGIKKKDRIRTMELLEAGSSRGKAILATGKYLGEGFDNTGLDTLFITMPVSFKGKLVQYAGRLHRKHPGKKNIQIYDYVDAGVPVLGNMFRRRMKTYKTLGYTIEEKQENVLFL
jgi:superfamily II DNA or RNA helicase